jgi:hypothetical protein
MANLVSSGAPLQPAHLLPNGPIGHTKAVFDKKAITKKAEHASGKMFKDSMSSRANFKGTTPSRGENFNMGASDGATAASAAEANGVAPDALNALAKL